MGSSLGKATLLCFPDYPFQGRDEHIIEHKKKPSQIQVLLCSQLSYQAARAPTGHSSTAPAPHTHSRYQRSPDKVPIFHNQAQCCDARFKLQLDVCHLVPEPAVSSGGYEPVTASRNAPDLPTLLCCGARHRGLLPLRFP